LLWTSDVLMWLHERYYQHNNESGDDAARPSVPEILASMRREVLRGCNVVLSGLIPIHKQNSTAESDRPRPPIVRYVEDLGGRILNSVTSEATHVVAAKDGTDKIVAARKVPGCVVVKTAWLMETGASAGSREWLASATVGRIEARELVGEQRRRGRRIRRRARERLSVRRLPKHSAIVRYAGGRGANGRGDGGGRRDDRRPPAA
jgi:BRCA1 C Terminus (BRCT) domain